MKMVRSLTKANVKKYGIEVREDLDFTDDGNRFRGFSYKGMPITQCVSRGECYLSIRVDCLMAGNNFTYTEWKQTKESELCDKFNGVSEFDIEELIENLEVVIAKVNEMNNEVVFTEEDERMVLEEISKEKEEIKGFINEMKNVNFRWWSISSYAFNRVQNYMNSLEKSLVGLTMDMSGFKDLSLHKKRLYLERVKRGKHIYSYYEWYISQIKEDLEGIV